MFKISSINKKLDIFISPSCLMCNHENRKYDEPLACHDHFFSEVTPISMRRYYASLFAEGLEGGISGFLHIPLQKVVKEFGSI